MKNLNNREVDAITKHLKAFLLTSLVLALYHGWLDEFSFGVQFYLLLSLFNLVFILLLNQFLNYLQNVLMVYSLILMLLQSTLAKDTEFVHPSMLIYNTFVVIVLTYSNFLATTVLVVGYILVSIFMSIEEGETGSFFFLSGVVVRIVLAAVVANYAYSIELSKKVAFSKGGRKVREYLKLKSILNILVPALVRDKVQSGKKNFSE